MTILLKNKVFILLSLFLLFVVNAHAQTPCMLCDFETGVNTNGAVGGGTGSFHHGGGADPKLDVVTPGVQGTDYCVNFITAVEEDPHTFYIDNPELRTLIEEAYGANRHSVWVKIPVGYTYGSDRNFHFGTYTRDPEIPSNIQGTHYYHLYNIPGSDYWTKIIANAHPSARTGSQDEISDNPTAPGWNYYDGFTRFYYNLVEYGSKPDGEWTWYFDEVNFYNETESENTISINALSCSYFGEGHFHVNWHGELRKSNNHHYELRYSTSPITNANYSSATIAPGCSDLVKVSGYSWIKADFTISITTGTAYFAIKDLTVGYDTYVTGIDYQITSSGESSAGSRPSGLTITGGELD